MSITTLMSKAEAIISNSAMFVMLLGITIYFLLMTDRVALCAHPITGFPKENKYLSVAHMEYYYYIFYTFFHFLYKIFL